MALSKAEKDAICLAADTNGFDYCFTDYSTWSEIKDKKFQELRVAYKKASDAMLAYIELDKWLINNSK